MVSSQEPSSISKDELPKDPSIPRATSQSPPSQLALPQTHIASSLDILEPSTTYQHYVQNTKDFISTPFTAAFIAGGAAGAVSRTLVSPLERLKILFQVQGPGNSNYQGIGPALMKMWREEGWRGFMRYRLVMNEAPYSAVQFSSYSIYKNYLLPVGATNLSTLGSLSAGAMAGITSVIATYPLDITRTRLSIITASLEPLTHKTSSQVPGMFSTMKIMYTTEGGVMALYRGLVPTLAGVAPYVGLNFAIYEAIRAYMTPVGEKSPSGWYKLGGGAVSGALAQTITYPFDLLRRRFQVNTMDGLGYQYKSVWDAISRIIKQEGVKGMYKGILPNLLKVAPSMASSWWTYEFVKDLCTSLDTKTQLQATTV